MSASTWIRRWFARYSPRRVPLVRQGKPRPRRSIRPLLEALEDRFAPAVLTVNTAGEGTTDTTHLDLREAVALVNAGGNPAALGQSSMPAGWASQISGTFGNNDTIEFASSLAGQTIHLSTIGENMFGPTALDITSNLTIAGLTGSHGVTIAGPGSSGGVDMRLFQVNPLVTLTLENLTLEGGYALGNNGGPSDTAGGAGGGSAGLGGAIFNHGTLNLINSTLTGNIAQGGVGGHSYTSATGGGGGGGGGLQTGGSEDAGYIGGNGGGIGGGPGGSSTSSPNGHPGGYLSGGGGGYGRNGEANGSGGYGGIFGGGGGGGIGVHGGTGGAGGLGGGGGGGGASVTAVSSYGGSGGASHGYGGSGGGGGGYGPQNTPGGGGGGGAGFGGAVFNYNGTVNLVNSTLYADKAYGGVGGGNGATAGQGIGGAVFNYNGTVTVTNSTLAGNTAERGGAIFDFQAADSPQTVTLNNTILANSVGKVTDYDTNGAANELSSGGNNLITHNNGFQGGIVSISNPKLSKLGFHGGPTPTLELMPGSPAIDKGNDALLSTIAAAEGVSNANATDQLGNVRIFGTHIDIGAVEFHPMATSLAYLKKPVSTTAGQTLATIEVKVLDQFGRLFSSDNTDTVTLSGAPFVSGSTSATVVNGIAMFNNLVVDKAGTYKLTASATNLTSTTASFTISPAAVASIAFLTEPSNETAGKAIAPAVKVELLDAFGNIATNSSSTAVTIALDNDPTGATLGGTTTVDTIKGVATFSTLMIKVKGTGYTLQASGDGFTAVSTAFNVT